MRQRMAAILCLLFVLGGAIGMTIGMVVDVQATGQSPQCCIIRQCPPDPDHIFPYFERGSWGAGGCEHYGTSCDTYCAPPVVPSEPYDFRWD